VPERINQVEAYSIVRQVRVFDRSALPDRTCSTIYFHQEAINS